jgi:hypothetical protein
MLGAIQCRAFHQARSRFLPFLALLALMLAWQPGAMLAEPKPAAGIVILDLTRPADEGRAADDKGPVLPDGCYVAARPLQSVLDALRQFEASGTPGDEKALRGALRALKGGCSDPERLLATKGDLLTIVLITDITDGGEPLLVRNETHRLTQVLQDVQTLVKALPKIVVKLAPGEPKATIALHRYEMTLKYVRANVSVKARSVREKEERPQLNDDSCKKGPACVVRSVSVVTGPPEHWFLTVDLPLNKVSDIKYDDKTGTLAPKQAPTVVYVGVDYMFSDILSPRDWKPLKALVVKAFIKAAKNPSDSFGVGIGYRPPVVDTSWLKLDAFQVFGAYVWNREDTISNGVPQPDSHYTGHWRGGVSFNIDKLVDWLKF